MGATLGLSNTWDLDNSFGFALDIYGRYRYRMKAVRVERIGA
ncbi:MAG: hypothetical protein R3F59_02760 [Myxococcota bacterium]